MSSEVDDVHNQPKKLRNEIKTGLCDIEIQIDYWYIIAREEIRGNNNSHDREKCSDLSWKRKQLSLNEWYKYICELSLHLILHSSFFSQMANRIADDNSRTIVLCLSANSI